MSIVARRIPAPCAIHRGSAQWQFSETVRHHRGSRPCGCKAMRGSRICGATDTSEGARGEHAHHGKCVAWGMPFDIGKVVVVRDRPVRVAIAPVKARWLVFLHTSDVRPDASNEHGFISPAHGLASLASTQRTTCWFTRTVRKCAPPSAAGIKWAACACDGGRTAPMRCLR